MTSATVAIFDEELAEQAELVAQQAITLLLDGTPTIRVEGREYQVIVVAAPAGAGKTEFTCSVVERAVARHPAKNAVIVVATPTNDQAYEMVRRIAIRVPGNTVAFVPAKNRNLPIATAALPNVAEVHASVANHYPIVVGTLDKLGDAHARGDLTAGFDFLVIDEAYQAHSAHYYGVAALADRHLLVGDPGQLEPFSTMQDADRWRGLPEDPMQSAVAVVCANHPSVPVLRLPITRRLPPSAVPIVAAFYPNHRFGAWTLPGTRSLTLLPAVSTGRTAVLDDAVQRAAAGWAYVRLPESPVLTADPATVALIGDLAARLFARGPTVTNEQSGTNARPLERNRVAVAVSHNDQKDAVRSRLDNSGLTEIRVDTANKLQGLEFDVVIAWHPLAGLPQPDGFHLDPGRLCVMLTRHRHACIVVGRAGDADLLESAPPPADAWLGYDGSPEIDGWFSHHIVFDQLSPHTVDLR